MSSTAIKILTWLYAVGAGATLVFIWFVRTNPALVDVEVWTHAIIVFGFALLLVDSTRRAAHGSRSGYRRLRIVSVVIPLVSIVLIVIPGLFPTWMKIEQSVYALVLLAVAVLASRDSVRSTFARPT
jgi:hypothetical protein